MRREQSRVTRRETDRQRQAVRKANTGRQIGRGKDRQSEEIQ